MGSTYKMSHRYNFNQTFEGLKYLEYYCIDRISKQQIASLETYTHKEVWAIHYHLGKHMVKLIKVDNYTMWSSQFVLNQVKVSTVAP
jgi:hypothetical protein